MWYPSAQDKALHLGFALCSVSAPHIGLSHCQDKILDSCNLKEEQSNLAYSFREFTPWLADWKVETDGGKMWKRKAAPHMAAQKEREK